MRTKRPETKRLYVLESTYTKKLKTVMKRLGAENYNLTQDLSGAWVEFIYHDKAYKFADSFQNAAKHGQKISYVSDIIARIVLSLEDLARMKDRGIYDLDTLLAGFPALPAASTIPDCFRVLGYDRIPENREDVGRRYKQLAKTAHPDAGGSAEQFHTLSQAYEQAVKYFEEAPK